MGREPFEQVRGLERSRRREADMTHTSHAGWPFLVLVPALLICACGQAGGGGWGLERADLLFMSTRSGNAEDYLEHGESSEWLNLTMNTASADWPD